MKVRIEAYKEERHGNIRDIKGVVNILSKTPQKSIQHIISLIRGCGFHISTLELVSKK